jgi:hypothetical protein
VNPRQLVLGLIAVPLLITGCAGPNSTRGSAAGTLSGQAMAGMTMAPGQTMASGDAMAGMPMTRGNAVPATPSPHTAAGDPSAAAKMVCSEEIRDKVRTVLKLPSPAPVRSSWKDQLFTCTYTLPMGTMVLSVKQSSARAGAHDYFGALRSRLAPTTPLIGLGEQAFATKSGIAVVLKDNMTLQVDTTRLPAVFGPQEQHRTDLAAEIASDVLGCWTGDEH